MKKRIVFAALLIMMIMAVPVFAQPTTKLRGDGSVVRVMFIAMDAQDQHWLKLNQGAQAAAAKAKIFYTMQAPFNKVDTAQQMNIMENAITAQYDVIMVAPQLATSLIASINKARAAGIKVIILDSPLPAGSNYDAFIGTDNGAAARTAADTLAKAIGGKGKIAIVNAQAGAGTTMIRENEFKARIAASYPNIQIVGTQYSDGIKERAMNQATDFMRAHPDLAGFYGCNEQSTTGIAAAVKQSGRKVVIVGWDLSSEAKTLILDGTIFAVIVQMPSAMGSKGIDAALALLSGKTVKRDDDSGCVVGTRANVAKL
ncbi:MAG: substrate-binding domain-containing protein [Treponema sp.]|jgi:ribose transport system substrate-binding protein|nr:substrate-binding domain-containing protein [Treponema sp.]